jgi:MFS family permease
MPRLPNLGIEISRIGPYPGVQKHVQFKAGLGYRRTMNLGELQRTWSALVTVSLGIFAITLDGSMMPVAIGAIIDGLKTQVSFVQAAMALHSLVMASMYLAAGKLGDRLGEKRVFVAGGVLFAAGTMIAALSPNIWVLLLGWSFIKPLGGALMIPTASSLIILNYEDRRRTTAFGFYSAFVAAAAVLGPLWMGAMDTALSWRWAFASETLIILLLLYFASMVEEADRPRTVAFDVTGALLTFVGLGLVVLGATLAGEFGWWGARRPFYIGDTVFAPGGRSAAFWFIAAGVGTLLVFAAWSMRQARRGKPVLFRMGLIRRRLFAGGVTLGFLFQVTVGGLLFVLPVFLQSALYLDSMSTALVLLPYTLGIFVFALTATRLPADLPPRRIVQIGLVLMLGGGFWVYRTAGLELAWQNLVPALFGFGAGAGLVLARLTEITLSPLAPDELGAGAGGDSTGKELGVAMGVAVLGSAFMLMVYTDVVVAYDAHEGLPVATSEERARAVVELEDWAAKLSDEQWRAYLASLPEATARAYGEIVAQAYVTGYRSVLRILLGVVGVMLLVSSWLKPPEARGET